MDECLKEKIQQYIERIDRSIKSCHGEKVI